MRKSKIKKGEKERIQVYKDLMNIVVETDLSPVEVVGILEAIKYILISVSDKIE